MKLLRVIIVVALILAICVVGGVKTANYYLEAQVETQSLHQQIRNQASYIKALQDYGEELNAYYSQLPPEIKVVTEIIYVDRPVERVVERVIIEEKEVEVIIYKNIHARNWESVEQFEQWYGDQHFTLLMATPIYTVDCDDYSEWVQRKALEQGYSVSEAMAKNHLYAGVWVTKINGLHAGNLVQIGNDYYWVEPQPDMFNIKQLFERD